MADKDGRYHGQRTGNRKELPRTHGGQGKPQQASRPQQGRQTR